eukprot:4659805-Pyramimonas_sp.AAC.1
MIATKIDHDYYHDVDDDDSGNDDTCDTAAGHAADITDDGADDDDDDDDDGEMLSCSFVAQAMSSPPREPSLFPRPYFLPFFTGRPDLPPWVPRALEIPLGLSGEFYHRRRVCDAPVYEISFSVYVCWDGVPGRSRVSSLRLWWSFGALTGFPGS